MSENLPTEFENIPNVMELIPNKVREAVERTYHAHPEWQNMNELDLADRVNPSPQADRVRLAFWKEYNRAQDTKKNMKMERVFGLVMTSGSFYARFLTHSRNVAWMMCPPSDLFLSMEADILAGKDELGKVLRTNLFDRYGKIKVNEARIFIKVFELYTNRVYGSVVNRIEQKTQNIPGPEPIEHDEVGKLLEEKRRKTIDVTPEEDDE